MFKKAEANIGLLIIFSVIVVIAAGTVGILFYFYKNALKDKAYVSVLGEKFVSLKDIQDLGLCKTSSYAKINYDPVNDIYTLICEKEIGANISKFPKIVVVKDCLPTSNTCSYKFKK